jgi:hypothetical protein
LEVVSYANELVIIVDLCELPELNNKIMTSLTEDGVA